MWKLCDSFFPSYIGAGFRDGCWQDHLSKITLRVLKFQKESRQTTWVLSVVIHSNNGQVVGVTEERKLQSSKLKMNFCFTREINDEPLRHAQLVPEAGERSSDPWAIVRSQLQRTAGAAQEQTSGAWHVCAFSKNVSFLTTFSDLRMMSWGRTEKQNDSYFGYFENCAKSLEKYCEMCKIT